MNKRKKNVRVDVVCKTLSAVMFELIELQQYEIKKNNDMEYKNLNLALEDISSSLHFINRTYRDREAG